MTPNEGEAQLGLLRACNPLSSELDARLSRDSAMTHHEFGLMSYLHAMPESTASMSEIAEATNTTLPRVSHVCQRLEGARAGREVDLARRSPRQHGHPDCGGAKGVDPSDPSAHRHGAPTRGRCALAGGPRAPLARHLNSWEEARYDAPVRDGLTGERPMSSSPVSRADARTRSARMGGVPAAAQWSLVIRPHEHGRYALPFVFSSGRLVRSTTLGPARAALCRSHFAWSGQLWRRSTPFSSRQRMSFQPERNRETELCRLSPHRPDDRYGRHMRGG